MTQCEQQELEFFTSISFEDLLHTMNVSGILSIRKSKRMVQGWNVSYNKLSRTMILTIPVILDSAPVPVKKALISWALLSFSGTRQERIRISRQRKELEQYIRQYLSQSGHLKPAITRIKRETLELKTTGTKFDLREIFNTVNKIYFDSTIQSYVRWGSRASSTSYQTIRTSSDGTRWNLITIAGIYNHPLVPQFAIESVMFHEMLHIAIPPYKKNGRNIIHSKEFKQAERQFPYYSQWRVWEMTEIRKIRKDLLKKR